MSGLLFHSMVKRRPKRFRRKLFLLTLLTITSILYFLYSRTNIFGNNGQFALRRGLWPMHNGKRYTPSVSDRLRSNEAGRVKMENTGQRNDDGLDYVRKVPFGINGEKRGKGGEDGGRMKGVAAADLRMGTGRQSVKRPSLQQPIAVKIAMDGDRTSEEQRRMKGKLTTSSKDNQKLAKGRRLRKHQISNDARMRPADQADNDLKVQGSKFAEASTPMTTPEIPKIIWTYWDNSTPPKFVQACISGWKRYNPDYRVTLITNKTLENYILTPRPTNFGKMDVRYRSDWVRLAVLSEQGGIWMDASTIVTGSLETIHRKQQKSRSEAFGYYRRAFTTNPSEPVFESFFIATIGHGKWITSWFNEFNKAFINFHMQDSYIDSLKRIHGLRAFRQLLQKNDVPSFLKIYLASQKILHIDGVAPPYGEDSESGPFWLLSRLDFNEEQYARALLLPFKEHEVPLMFKLRGEARGLLMGLLGNSSTKIWPESIYARFVQEHVVKGERGSGFLSFWSSKSKEKEFVVEDEKDASGVKTGGQRKRTMGAIIGRMLGYNAQ